MLIDEHVTALRREGELMALALARADLDRTVSTCPEWTVRELSHHVGRVHRWAATHVRERLVEQLPDSEEERVWGVMPADSDLVAWFTEGHQQLVDALSSAPAELICWVFLPAPSPLAFWARRQAHETAIHRADTEGTFGPVTGVDVDFAVDGIDELLLCFYAPRPRNRVRSDVPRTLGITASDAAARWLIHIGPNGAHPERSQAAPGSAVPGSADCEVRGPVSDLYLGLWNRARLDVLQVSGDATLIDIWRSGATVRWS